MSKPIKIAHLSSAHKDGDVRIFHKECVSLAEAGYDVSMVISNTASRVERGVNIVSVENTSSSRFFRAWRTVNQVYRLAIKLDATIYHLHDPELLRIALKLKRRGKIVIYDAHEDLPRQLLAKNYIPKFWRKTLSYFVERYENGKARKLNGIITATPFIRDRFLKINPNTVDINNFPLLEEIDFTDTSSDVKAGSVCYVGLINEVRGIGELILAAGISKIKVDLAGELNDSLKLKFQKLYGWENINQLGLISRADSLSLKKKSIAGMVPFLYAENHINAQPNKIFEYMASGLPVICSNFDLWKQIVEANECGICVDPSDPRQIADAMTKISGDPDLAKRLGQNGIRLVKEKYNWEVERKKLMEFYNKIVSTK